LGTTAQDLAATFQLNEVLSVERVSSWRVTFFWRFTPPLVVFGRSTVEAKVFGMQMDGDIFTLGIAMAVRERSGRTSSDQGRFTQVVLRMPRALINRLNGDPLLELFADRFEPIEHLPYPAMVIVPDLTLAPLLRTQPPANGLLSDVACPLVIRPVEPRRVGRALAP
jgi:hypothetical protein